jgi:CheY-like chemotaxis protein
MEKAKKKIVIVDDDKIELELLEGLFGEEYELHLIDNETEALKEIENIAPDLVIMDIMMPQFDGVSIYIAMKQNERIANIPVIFITAIEDAEYKEQMQEWGASGYITKPFDREYLHNLLHKLLG